MYARNVNASVNYEPQGRPDLVMVANEHEGGLGPALELAEHGIERLDRQTAPRMPEVACKRLTAF